MTGAKQIIVGGLLALGLGALPAPAAAQTANEEPPPTRTDVADGDAPSAEQPAKAPSAETRRRVGALLDGIESNPTPQQWQALDEGAARVLIEIAEDHSIPVVRRGRAVTALVHFDTPQARTAVAGLVTAEQTSKHLRRKAIHTLAKLAGEEALPALKPHLAAKSARLREATIDAVGMVRTSAAKALLRGRFSEESQDYLKKKIGEYLAMPTRKPKSLQPLADVPVTRESEQ